MKTENGEFLHDTYLAKTKSMPAADEVQNHSAEPSGPSLSMYPTGLVNYYLVKRMES